MNKAVMAYCVAVVVIAVTLVIALCVSWVNRSLWQENLEQIQLHSNVQPVE